MTADKDDKKVLKAAVDNPEAAGLQAVARGAAAARRRRDRQLPRLGVRRRPLQGRHGGEADSDYADPVEFFARTYLTEGLRDLIGRAVRRLSGDDNASPVINLQTNFGGGKTHSMLALWHLAAGLPVGEFPQDAQELLAASGYDGAEGQPRRDRRQPLQPVRGRPRTTAPRSTRSGASWPGSSAARRRTRSSPRPTRDRTHPGEALHELLATYAPAVILIDEWVAYARSLVGRDDLAGGTFDDQFTFAQSLTEAVKGTSGVLLAISIPASETGDDADKIVAGNAEEVGGANGLEALKRLQNVVRRVADQWRPASSDEAYHIVKQRLFKQPDAAALAVDRRDGAGVRRDVPQVRRRLPARGPRRGVRGPDQADLPDPPGAVRPPLRGLVDPRAVPAHPRRAAPDEHRDPRAVGGRGRLAADHAGLDPARHRERERRADAVPAGLVEGDHRRRRRRPELRAGADRQGEAAVRPALADQAPRAHGVLRRRADDRGSAHKGIDDPAGVPRHRDPRATCRATSTPR